MRRFMRWGLLSCGELPDKLVNEIYLTFARYFSSVASPHFSVNAEDVLFHCEQALLYILLVRLVKTLAIRTEVMIISQPLKQPLFAYLVAVLSYHLGKFTN